MKRIIVFIVGCFALSSAAWATPSIQLRADVAPKEIYIGDVIRYNLTVIFSSDVAATPLQLAKQVGDFDVLAYSASPPSLSEGKTTIVHQMALTTFSTGTLIIPEIPLRFATTDGKQLEAKTTAVPINVRSLLQEKGDLGNLRPLKGFFNFKSYLWLWILLGVLAGGTLIFFIVRRVRRKKLELEDNKPKRPAEETANDAIKELESSDLLANGQSKEFYYQLSLIFRRYLEDRYGFSALDRTTSELYSEFRTRKFDPGMLMLSRDFLDNADLVKFAKFTPNEEDITHDLDRVKQFVELTTPKGAQEPALQEAPTL